MFAKIIARFTGTNQPAQPDPVRDEVNAQLRRELDWPSLVADRLVGEDEEPLLLWHQTATTDGKGNITWTHWIQDDEYQDRSVTIDEVVEVLSAEFASRRGARIAW